VSVTLHRDPAGFEIRIRGTSEDEITDLDGHQANVQRCSTGTTVEKLTRKCYSLAMDKTTEFSAPPAMVADLLASKAEAERGETVPMQPVLDRIEAAISRVQADRPTTGQA
jgi:hypothetical protein